MKKYRALSKGVREVLTPGSQADHRLFAPLFCALNLIAPREQPAALPTVGQENGCRTRIRFDENPPRFEVCGDVGWKTSETVGKRSHLSQAPALCRSGSVRAAHTPIPAGGITERTRVTPQPVVQRQASTAALRGRVSITPCCIILT